MKEVNIILRTGKRLYMSTIEGTITVWIHRLKLKQVVITALTISLCSNLYKFVSQLYTGWFLLRPILTVDRVLVENRLTFATVVVP